ncbi:MAG: 50S ribosomal protein L32 [Xenococcaceae cyanobacterium MO_167.B52]|nr:50S ribosomal protein L32 [Xenococcaceae cyanobacterium MO_167.B52]
MTIISVILGESNYNNKVVLFYFLINMAVPKKKTSKSKRNSRKAHWKRKAALEAKKALSLGKSVLTGRSNSFVYPEDEDEDDEE